MHCFDERPWERTWNERFTRSRHLWACATTALAAAAAAWSGVTGSGLTWAGFSAAFLVTWIVIAIPLGCLLTAFGYLAGGLLRLIEPNPTSRRKGR